MSGFDYKTCSVLSALEEKKFVTSQREDGNNEVAARGQGVVFGYATDETEECMPLTIHLAHRLNAKISELRHSGQLPWARPDSKAQVK